jgi:hypothetical protein
VACSESRAPKGKEASATIIDAVYKGSVIDGSGTDDLGLFGPAGASLVGDSFVVTFEIDTSKGIPRFTATENYIHGGSLYGVDSPMLSATLEINGKTADVGTGLSDSVQSFLGQSGVANQHSHGASSASSSILLDVINANLASVGNIPFTIDVPLTFNFDSSVSGGGEAFFKVGATGTSLSLSPTHLVYQYPSSDRVVPEHSNWATMLLGFLGLGYAGYRK